MTRPVPPRACRRLAPVAALSAALAAALSAALAGTLILPALAQGTREQQEACTPDALRLCSDTIPDIGRTTACMTAHKAELSPRCRAAFSDATAPAPRERRARREVPPAADGYGPREYEYLTPDGRPAEARRVAPPDDEDAPPVARRRYVAPPDADDADGEDVDRARAVVGRLCEDQALDPASCEATQRALDRAQ